MNKGSNTPTADPQIAGLGERQTPTQEQGIAHTYFAGARNLKCVWIMQPVNQFTRETNQPKNVKNYGQPLLWSLGDSAGFPGVTYFLTK